MHQPALLEQTVAVRTVSGAEAAGVELPVARVAVDMSLPHLDRPFDYRVTPEQDAAAQPGTRVSVRFAGKDRTGYVLERAATTDHHGTLMALRRVVSALPVLTPEITALCRAVADRYAGTFMDVARLAVPPRHATTEKAVLEGAAADRTGTTAAHLPGTAWDHYVGGAAYVRRLAAGESPRAVWSALPAHEPGVADRLASIAEAAAATLASGRGVVVVVPSAHEAEVVEAALTAALPGEPVVSLQADHGPSRRYRAFVRLLTGQARVVVGTRAAAFAPVQRVGLLVCWDDGDDLLAEPRAPYPHAREVLTLRAAQEGAGLLLGGWSRSVEAGLLVATGWAASVTASRATVRERTPRVEAPGEVDLAREGPAAAARIPRPAWELVRKALEKGPVLVQVPRSGYLPVVACQGCREPARCRECHGPLQLGGRTSVPSCRWCGRPDRTWACPTCGSSAMRASRVGSARTAEELGRAFPKVPVVLSGARADHGIVREVDERARLVVATPGAEPVARGGYQGALLLDAAAISGRQDLAAPSEALRRWLAAAALVRPASEGGRVMLLGDPAPVPAQALVRWDPAGFAERELAERRELHLPPASRMASVRGSARAVAGLLRHLERPDGVEVLGPVPFTEEEVQALVRSDLGQGSRLTKALAQAAAVRSAHKEPDSVRIQVDPTEL
ncbi:replication restart DNA helicase PriA [Georgenia satyanarayanai]|uniref:Probable replication restart protein PriA n=1 Tax=Georgenia satyanarayanai TaxID=860221 RepID=A0A2Y9A0X1_9MICO|nr:primosomal protein N' [Georgenia satyanarayanai]PYG02313.1 replication restart DNA helicase PriA [Georgenia satyanarayanai]SSA37178.1 replication restart DNA helicase PriA [Georgenia satyanarayanai]